MKREKDNQTLTILANDPSFSSGWGVVVLQMRKGQPLRVLHMDCIKTQPQAKKLRIRVGDDTMRRSHEINCFLLTILDKYGVNFLVSELPHGSQSAVAAKMLGMASDKIQSIADALGIPVEWYSEGDCKKAVLGKPFASKQETVDAIAEKIKPLGVSLPPEKYKREAIADAFQVFFTAQKNSPFLKFFTS